MSWVPPVGIQSSLEGERDLVYLNLAPSLHGFRLLLVMSCTRRGLRLTDIGLLGLAFMPPLFEELQRAAARAGTG